MLTISKGKINRAVKTVIYGTEGVGKSTLASQFPEPLFIDVEGGTSQMDVRRIEKPETWEDLIAIVREVAATPDICETLVLDTADFAESMCIAGILKKYNQKSIESFGYGKGYTYIGEEWQKLMDAFNACIAAGKNVTVIAHARQRKIELVAPLLKEWADLLLFLNYKTYVVTTENNSKKAQGGKRVMFTTHNPVYDAKNRHGLPDELDLNFAGIARIFSEPKPAELPLDRLHELMAEAGITEYQVREVVAAKGHYPIETPLSDYSERIVNGFCIKYFDKIVDMIKSKGENND